MENANNLASRISPCLLVSLSPYLPLCLSALPPVTTLPRPMKSERRHELKTNALSQQLEGFPDYWREYGNKVLLAVILGLLVFMAVRYYRDKKARDIQEVATAQEAILSNMGELDQLQMMEAAGAPGTIDARRKVSSTINDAISTILNTSKDPKILARAYLAQADLDWKLANLPDPPGATTRPDLKIPNREGLLGGAAEYYAKVLDPPYSGDALDLFTARMGLAAVNENRGKWDEAKSQYQAIVDAKSLPQSFKDVASKRLASLPEYQKGALLNPPPEPTTTPSILGPESPMFPNATTAPSSMPSMSTTMPAGPVLPATSMPAVGITPPTTAPATQP